MIPSPVKDNFGSQSDSLRLSMDGKRFGGIIANSPKSLHSPPPQGRRVDENKTIHLEVSSNDNADERPKFPIRIPIDQMVPKKNYLQIRKSDANIFEKTAKAHKSDRNLNVRPASQTGLNNKPKKGKESLKRVQTSQSDHSKIIDGSYSGQEPKDLKRAAKNMIQKSANDISEKKKTSSIEYPMNQKTIKTRSHSTKRPASSRSSNAKKTDELRRSSQVERREKESLRFGASLQQEFFNTEEHRKELEKRANQIVTENLKRYTEMVKAEEERRKREEEEKKERKNKITSRNNEILEKNRLRVNSGSPVKHKYDWGADQQRLEMKPQTKDSGKKNWQKVDSPRRREIIGLAHLNTLPEEAVKKVKTEWRSNLESAVKQQTEEKYKTKRKEKSPLQKEKLKTLVTEQFEKKAQARKIETEQKKKEKLEKQTRLDALRKNIEEIRLKDKLAKEEAKKAEEAKGKKKVTKKKKKRPFQIHDENVQENSGNDSAEKEEGEQEGESDNEVNEIMTKEQQKQRARFFLQALQSLDESFNAGLVQEAFYILLAHSSEVTSKERKSRSQPRTGSAKKEEKIETNLRESIQQKKSPEPVRESSIKEKKSPEPKSSKKSQANESEKKGRFIAEDFDVEEEILNANIDKNAFKNIGSQRVGFEQVQKGVGYGSSQKKNKTSTYAEIEVIEERFGSGGKNRGRMMEKPKSSKKQQEDFDDEDDYERYGRRKEYGRGNSEEKDFDDLLFNMSSEELIRLPYFSIAKEK